MSSNDNTGLDVKALDSKGDNQEVPKPNNEGGNPNEEPVSKKIKLDEGAQDNDKQDEDKSKIIEPVAELVANKAADNVTDPVIKSDNHNQTLESPHKIDSPVPHHHHHHPHIPHHHHHYDPEKATGPIPHIHTGHHIHLVKPPTEVAIDSNGVENEKDKTPDNNALVKDNEEQDNQDKEEDKGEGKVAEEGENKDEGKEEEKKEEKNEDKGEEKENDDTKEEIKTTNPNLNSNATLPNSLSKNDILDVIKTVFPKRHHLGALVYNPTTTWLTLQTSQLTGLKDEHFEKFEELRESYREKLKDEYYARSVKYIPMIPPLPTDYINYLLEVKIPYRFIKTFLNKLYRGEISTKRELWGGVDGVYTDDSDILTVLAHLGFFNNNINLKEWNNNWTINDIIIPSINKNNEIKGDISVTLLLLPGLKKYESVYANGINSRSWKEINKHDGLSFAIYNIKWELEGSYLRDKSFFKRYQTELSYDEKYMRQTLESKDGWEFDVKLYKQLKEKFDNLKKQPVKLNDKEDITLDNKLDN